MNLDLSKLINNALIYYDKNNIEYEKYINTNNIIIERETNTIKFSDVENKEFKCLEGMCLIVAMGPPN